MTNPNYLFDGTITNDLGEPLPGVTLYLYARNRPKLWVAETISDINGNWALPGTRNLLVGRAVSPQRKP